MKNLEGTKTKQNLLNAFAGESQARNRYTIYSKIAKKEGYEQIAQIFLDTAENEREHAKLFYQHINNCKTGQVNAPYSFELGTTKENLESALNGEKAEWETIYQLGESDARAEGFEDIAETFKYIRTAEKHHFERYTELLKNITKNTIFKKDTENTWICRKCAYHINAKEAPDKCPLCKHPQAYFEILCEKF